MAQTVFLFLTVVTCQQQPTKIIFILDGKYFFHTKILQKLLFNWLQQLTTLFEMPFFNSVPS